MIDLPAFRPDAREGGWTRQQRRQVDGAETAQDEDHDEGDLPPANANRTTRFPLRNPSGFLLQLLQETGSIRVPRMDVVQMANEVLRFHRDIADWTAVHLRHGDLVRDRMRERIRSYLGVPRTRVWIAMQRDKRNRIRFVKGCPTKQQHLFVARSAMRGRDGKLDSPAESVSARARGTPRPGCVRAWLRRRRSCSTWASSQPWVSSEPPSPRERECQSSSDTSSRAW